VVSLADKVKKLITIFEEIAGKRKNHGATGTPLHHLYFSENRFCWRTVILFVLFAVKEWKRGCLTFFRQPLIDFQWIN